MMKTKKKCPICGKPYNDYLKHVWTHKAKTVKYLQEKRKAKLKSSPHGSTKSKSSKSGVVHQIMALLEKI